MTMTSDHPSTTTTTWLRVCAVDDLLPGRGVAALVGHAQVALFRLPDDAVHAIGNHDPFSGANVLSRGLTGTWDGRTTVASPVYKQRFDLATGVCIDDQATSVPVYATRVVDGSVFVGVDAMG